MLQLLSIQIFINQEDVTNSAEIEQEAEQVNEECEIFADCENTIVAQIQAENSATVVNALFVNQEDGTNSAEIEQEIEQVNEKCDTIAACENTIVAQYRQVILQLLSIHYLSTTKTFLTALK